MKNRPVFALRRRNFFQDRRARVIIRREAAQEPIAQHRHEFFEIAIVTSGTGVHVTGHFRHPLQAGDVLVLNNRRTHGYEETRNLALVNILIRGDCLLRLGRHFRDLPGYRTLFAPEPAEWQRRHYAGHLRVGPAELNQIGEWVARVEEEVRNGSEGGYLLAEAYLSLIIGVLSRRCGREPDLPTPPERFTALLARAEKHPGQPLNVAEMARQAGMSERTFHRTFRACMGVPPMTYLLQLRLRLAADLLRKGACAPRVGEVAQTCGFQDSNYFSRCFRKFKGMSPREFRRTPHPA